MRPLHGKPFDGWRDKSPETIDMYGSTGDETCGVFNVRSISFSAPLFVIASVGEGWEHVSVSLKWRCPTWDEMSFVKRAFFYDDEWAVEYHPPVRDNINVMKFCLHLWRPNDGTLLPAPPSWMIG